jgi:hypothetical protein
MRNTADVTGGKPIAILLQSISTVSDINPLVAFYNIHGGTRDVLFYYFIQDTTQDHISIVLLIAQKSKNTTKIDNTLSRLLQNPKEEWKWCFMYNNFNKTFIFFRFKKDSSLT